MSAARDALAAIEAAVSQLASEQSIDRIVMAAGEIYAARSRVICTGMGKCWHIAGKIAATLQSTGQPASALHPGEAHHGDMGAIMAGDLLLALSNSGETDEVLGVANFARSHGSKLITITSNPESPLAQMADHVLLVPEGPEGCPLGRAPMASAAAMMAIGDALAAELMSRRGFTEADFLALHHGGYLGRQLRAVA
jgi:arabinose-5-phosphate isomerase